MRTTALTAVPPPADRAAFQLTEEEERVLIAFIVGVRRSLRRGLGEGRTPAGILEGYSAAVADWPARRRDAILEAVRAALAPVPPLCLIPSVNGDGIGRDLDGDAA